MAELRVAPLADWGARSNVVREVYYQGEPYQGKPTRVFAYYARPASGRGPFPALALVHGGGGRAFPEWAEHWARRGYVALAMDTAGHGPNGRLPDGGPDQDDDTKFRPFTDSTVDQMWSYHAVAAVVRGLSLLAAQPEVDPRRLGVTGLSWGGYLTCIVAGIDDRLKVAVPGYGCGFLDEDSVWKASRFDRMSPDQHRRWMDNFDPSRYLSGVRCPILFLNGTTDFAYPLDSYQKSYDLVRGPRTLCIKIGLPHGHIWTFGEVDCFIDSVLRHDPPLARVEPLKLRDDRATTTFSATVPVATAELDYTTDTGPWQQRVWQRRPAEVHGHHVSAALPARRPLVCFLAVTDQRGFTVSTPHRVLP